MNNMFSIFRIGSSGLTAQRKLIETTASNIANAETVETETGGPYIPKRIRFRETKMDSVFGRMIQSEISRVNTRFISREKGLVPTFHDSRQMTGSGVEAVEAVEKEMPIKRIYDPENPDADADGYVEKPNINVVKEMTDMMTASRAYEANVTVMNAAKAMMKKALDI